MSCSSGFGKFVSITARGALPRFWLGPSVAVLCGAIGGGGVRVEVVPLTRLVLALLLADGLWGAVWREAGTAIRELEGSGPVGVRVYPRLPYTLPGSAGDRWAAWMVGWRRLWERAPQAPREAVVGISVLGLISLSVGALLGPGALLATAAAGLILLLSTGQPFRGGAPRIALHALYGGGLAWALGYLISAPLGGWPVGGGGTFGSALAGSWGWGLVWAGLFSICLYGSRQLAKEEGGGGIGFLVAGQAAGVAALLLDRHPLLALGVGLLLVPQILLRPGVLRGRAGHWYLSRVRLFPVISMFAGAIAVAS